MGGVDTRIDKFRRFLHILLITITTKEGRDILLEEQLFSHITLTTVNKNY